MRKFSKKTIYNISILIMLVSFLGIPQIRQEGRSFEKKMLEVISDKESLEIPVIDFMPFDWDTVRMARYARYYNFLRGADDNYMYSLEFQDVSGKVIKEIVLPLRFVSAKPCYALSYRRIPYLSKEKFGRDAKFKIKRIPSMYRNGGNEIYIEIN